MRLPTTSGRSHPASFTLIELVVVMAIIAVLISLLLPAVNKIRVTAIQAETRTEIGQMDSALSAALSELHGASYFPSKLVLREDGQYSSANPAHVVTVQVLTSLFGKGVATLNPTPGTAVQVDWNGDGGIATGIQYTLEGEECLVFILGGIPTAPPSGPGVPDQPGVLGFSKNPALPSALGGARYGPYYQGFTPARLIRSPSATAPNFLRYKDPYGTNVYAFFSNNGTTYGDADCLSLGVAPYYSSVSNGTKLYLNPKGVQIISAGMDGKFGLGGQWNPSVGYPPGNPGADDVSNFSKAVLGVGTN